MTRISANAVRVHKLEVQKIHNDTTSITLFGSYDNFSEGASALPTYGYNKDGHPDCKQIVFGLNLTSDGKVPPRYKTYDGNTMDSDTHIPLCAALRQPLKTENFIYITDSKLCSFENTAYIAENNRQFITLMPKNRKEVKEFHARLKTCDIPWTFAFERQDKRRTNYDISSL